MKKTYYKKIDYIRVLLCLSVLFYHVGILKGGYLAVNCFFALSGYLAVTSFLEKKEFSLKEYYYSRFKRLYLPLITVVFLTIAFLSFFSNIHWINLKPETTSILLGYNNYWQINANLDYFVRNISSPFMHLWFIAIMIQIELVLPFFLLLFKKIDKKNNGTVPCIIIGLLAIGSCYLFLHYYYSGKIMMAYYDTFARLFSLLFGLLFGYISSLYNSFTLKSKGLSKIIYYFYLLVIVLLFIFIDDKSKIFELSMILVSILGLRLIEYAKLDTSKFSSFDKIISFISKSSYEIYLVQYPIIYFLQQMKVDKTLSLFLVLILSLLLSFIIHYAISINKKNKNLFRIIVYIIVSLISIYGLYIFIISKDYTKDMKKLESDLSKNRSLIEEKQKEFLEKKRTEDDEWLKTLESINNTEESIKNYVTNLNIVGIGDSIMELAVKDLYKVFPNGYFDAAVNRTEYKANDILVDLKNKGLLGDVILFNLGTNGSCSTKCKEQIMETIGDRKLYWLNTTNADYDDFNDRLYAFAANHSNIHIIDWLSVTKAHPEYLISDRVHPTVTGCRVYADTIYDAIYQDYLNEFNSKKDQMIKEHEEKIKNRVSFIGNDLLLGIMDNIQKDNIDADFSIDKDYTFSTIKKKIIEKINDNTLNYNVVLVFDNSIKLSNNEYNELVELCKDHSLYIVDLYNYLDNGNNIIKFNEELNNNDYLLFDNKHLNDKGNLALEKKISVFLNNDEKSTNNS